MSRRRKMARLRAEAATKTTAEASPFAAMDDDALADLAREKGVKGVQRRWHRETIIRKIKELDR